MPGLEYIVLLWALAIGLVLAFPPHQPPPAY
jgi:hypothetical protein